MSSIFDRNININIIGQKRTATLAIDLSVQTSRYFDITQLKWGGIDFIPDACLLKYIAYSSFGAVSTDVMPILTCDFLDGDILAPFLARTSVQSFNIFHKVSFPNGIQKIQINVKSMQNEELDCAYQNGTVLVCLEFIRYHRNHSELQDYRFD